LTSLDPESVILELCSGEGLLAEIVLEKFPGFTVLGLDGSEEMLNRAQERLARFGKKFRCGRFDLAEQDWRKLEHPLQAVISSLGIHHLEGLQKQELFKDVLQMLEKGGLFIIADIVEMQGESGKRVAAEVWDEAVRKRSLELDGNTEVYEFFVREGWNTFRYLDPEDIDKPSPLFDQLKWLEEAGFVEVDVHWMQAGHAIFSGSKPGICQ